MYSDMPPGFNVDTTYSDIPAGFSPVEGSTEDEWSRAQILPFAINKRTGERAFALPQVLATPGEVFQGKKQIYETNPITSEQEISPEGLGLAQGTASVIAGGQMPGGWRPPLAKGSAPIEPKMEPVAKPAAPEFSDIPEGFKTEPDFAGNINLKNVAAEPEVKTLLKDTAETNDNFADARRGTISFEQTREMADLVGMTPEKLSQRLKGQAFNAETMLAARNLLVEQATKVRDLAKTASRGSDADKLSFSEELTKLVAAQEQVSGATAEAGRALSQFRMLAGASKEQIARFVDAAKQGGRLDDIIEKINTLDDPSKVAQFASGAFKAKTTDQLLEVWINALLSGPQTHATNALSNTLVSLWAIPERAVAAGVSKVTGSGIHFGEAAAKAFGSLEGAMEGLRAGARTFKTEEPSDFTGKIEAARYRAIPGAVGRAVRIPGRALMAADEVFKAVNYRGEINAQAYRQATSEGLTGQALSARIGELRGNPTEAMKTAARNAAEEQTFTNPLGEGGKAIQRFANTHAWAKVIVPFVRTPVNIVKYAAFRSPFAPIFKEVRADLSGSNGPIARDMAIARIGLGSTASATAAYLASQGLLTGQGPDDPRARGLLYQIKWQPYSVKIGNEYYSYSRLEPLGTLLGVAADFTELSRSMTEDEKKSVAALIIGSMAKNITSKTFLRGLSDLMEAVQDPDRAGQKYVESLTGTVVPTGIAQVARVNDPYLREARSVLDNIKSRIPGLRETLPAKRDIFGKPIKLEGALGPDILSPIYTSTVTRDPVVEELLRLKVYPSNLMRTVNKTELSAEDYGKLQEVTGELMKSGLGRLIGSPRWNTLPDDKKKDMIQKLMIKLRAFGRAQLMQAQ